MFSILHQLYCHKNVFCISMNTLVWFRIFYLKYTYQRLSRPRPPSSPRTLQFFFCKVIHNHYKKKLSFLLNQAPAPPPPPHFGFPDATACSTKLVIIMFIASRKRLFFFHLNVHFLKNTYI